MEVGVGSRTRQLVGLLAVVTACSETTPSVGSKHAALSSTDPREIAFVLHAGRTEGYDCIEESALPFLHGWECNPEPAAGFDAQKAGLAAALQESLEPARGYRISVIVNTVGQLRWSNGREHYDGPVTAIARRLVTNQRDLVELASEIRAIPLPTQHHMPPARNVCPGWPRSEGRCTPGASPPWGIYAASQVLAAAPNESFREICMATSDFRPVHVPNAGVLPDDSAPTFPPEAFSPLLAAANSVAERISIVAYENDRTRFAQDNATVLQLGGQAEESSTIDATITFQEAAG